MLELGTYRSSCGVRTRRWRPLRPLSEIQTTDMDSSTFERRIGTDRTVRGSCGMVTTSQTPQRTLLSFENMACPRPTLLQATHTARDGTRPADVPLYTVRGFLVPICDPKVTEFQQWQRLQKALPDVLNVWEAVDGERRVQTVRLANRRSPLLHERSAESRTNTTP
jgi:hypothetical protein